MSVSCIGSRIKTLRKVLNLSQKDFSQSIFLSPSFYGKVENGTRNANERICELICSRYKVNRDWLVNGTGENMFSEPSTNVELMQLMEIINGLDPLFREYIVRQIKLFAELHKKSKELTNEKDDTQ